MQNWMTLKVSSDIQTFLNKFKAAMQSMRDQGVGVEKLIRKITVKNDAGEDVEDYMVDEHSIEDYRAGLSLILRLKDSVYKNHTKEEQDDQLLCYPHCHYDAVLDNLKVWDDLIQHGVDGTGPSKKRKRTESNQALEGRINAVVAKNLKKFSHNKTPNKKSARKTAGDKSKKKEFDKQQ